ncbi:MAG TPA: M14 family zinc carboxypeptidase, partial [Thermoanaerobaculia bacterium]
MIRRLAALAALLLLAASAFAQVPTPDEYLAQHNLRFTRDFTPWNLILGYYDELARRSNLVSIERIGATYENRPLVLLTITSPKNRAALDQIRANVTSLAKGSADANRAADIAKNGPAIVWLGFGVHGNESSSAEAAMRVASTLLRDEAATKLLDDLVVVIDPLQNPDGRERYIQWFTRTRGAQANTNADAFEHNEPWPGGRFNHYLIDMNRDWTWLSQRETQARVAAYQRWYPQVFVDFHEMGYTSSYFFPPDAAPINVHYPNDIEKWLETFGRANANEFSQRNWQFFVGERFDLFYPGYGDSWPSMNGAVGMTYEVAGHGRGGVAVEREDGSVLTLGDRIDRHFTTAMATVRTAAANREALLRYTYDAAR